jgi:hypothetical protein
MQARAALLSSDWRMMSRLVPEDAHLSTFSGFVSLKVSDGSLVWIASHERPTLYANRVPW